MEKMQPNTTQIPHYIIRELMPHLGESELKVLLVITDQTLGWVEDAETGRRKEKDWISVGQFTAKTGVSRRSVSRALDALVKKDLIESMKSDGAILETPAERQRAGSRILYRLKTRQATLFDKKKTCAKTTQVKGGCDNLAQGVSQNYPPTIWRTTKETDPTKETNTKHCAPESAQDGKRKTWRERKEAGEPVDDTTILIDWFGELNPNHYRLFSMRTQREAAGRIIKRHGLERMVATVQFVAENRNEKYCPTITTPVQLENRLGDLIAFKRRSEAGKSQVAFI